MSDEFDDFAPSYDNGIEDDERPEPAIRPATSIDWSRDDDWTDEEADVNDADENDYNEDDDSDWGV